MTDPALISAVRAFCCRFDSGVYSQACARRQDPRRTLSGLYPTCAYRTVRATKRKRGAKGHVPIFQHPNGKVVFYAHVPKTGGTYIEDLLVANGLERQLWNPKPAKWGIRISPQHWHRDIYETFLDLGKIDLGFISVRHPVDRLLSEYRWRVKRGEATTGFPDWLEKVSGALDADASCLDNHLRPQVDFFHPMLEIHRQEIGFGERWARALGFRSQAHLTQHSVPRRLQTKGRVDVSLSADDLDRAVAFCQARYAEDFAFFDYDVAEAEALADPGGTAVPLRHATLPKAVIAPPEKVDTEEARPGRGRGLRGGVFDSTAQMVPASGLVRNNEKLVYEAQIPPTEPRNERVIFAGYNFSHFGHFLIESLARLWYLDAFPDDKAKIVWAKIGRANGAPNLLPWQLAILEILRIENEVEMIDRPVEYSEVVVPWPAAEVPNVLDPKMARFFERSGIVHTPTPGRKIWLSRSKLEGKGTTRGIEAAEAKLEKGGWTIVHPQELPIHEQLDLLAKAERVAGEEGSALHLLLFIAGAQEMRVDILPRAERLSENFWQIARAKGLQQHEIETGRPKMKFLPGRKADKSYRTLRPLLDTLL